MAQGHQRPNAQGLRLIASFMGLEPYRAPSPVIVKILTIGRHYNLYKSYPFTQR